MITEKRNDLLTKFLKHKLKVLMGFAILILCIFGYLELTKYNPQRDLDKDGLVNEVDKDDNGDGVKDINDPKHPEYDEFHRFSDFDGDGITNQLDNDDNNDGLMDVNDFNNIDFIAHHPDTDLDKDGLVNRDDDDDDGDSIPDSIDPEADFDLDGTVNSEDRDDNGDGILDINDVNHADYADYDDNSDYDQDGEINSVDSDDDNDGLDDVIDLDHPDCFFTSVEVDTSMVEEIYNGYVPAFYFHGEKTYDHEPILIYKGKIISENNGSVFAQLSLIDTKNDIIHLDDIMFQCDEVSCGGMFGTGIELKKFLNKDNNFIKEGKDEVLAISNNLDFVLYMTPLSKGEDVKLYIYSVLKNKITYSSMIKYEDLSELYFDNSSYTGSISDNGRYIFVPVLKNKIVIDTYTSKVTTIENNKTIYQFDKEGNALIYSIYSADSGLDSLYFNDKKIEDFTKDSRFLVYKSSDNSFLVDLPQNALYLEGTNQKEVEFVELHTYFLTNDQISDAKIFNGKPAPVYMIGDKVYYNRSGKIERHLSIDNPNIVKNSRNGEIEVIYKSIDGDKVGLQIKFDDDVNRSTSITFVNDTYYVSFSKEGKKYLLGFNEKGIYNHNLEVDFLAKVNDKLYAADEKHIYDVYDNNKIVYTAKDCIINQLFSFRDNVYFQELPDEEESQYTRLKTLKYTSNFIDISSFEAPIGVNGYEVNFTYFINLK